MAVIYRTPVARDSRRSRPIRTRQSRPIRTRPRDPAPIERPSALGAPEQRANGRAADAARTRPRVSQPDDTTLSRAEELTGGKLLLTDVRTAFLLANEARYRTLERLFGLRRDQANLATLIALGLLMEVAHDKLDYWLQGPGPPTRADAALGAAVSRELLYDIAGPSSRDTPLFGTLVLLGVVGGLSGPALRRSFRGVRTLSHRARRSFNHRYGQVFGGREDHHRGRPRGSRPAQIIPDPARVQDGRSNTATIDGDDGRGDSRPKNVTARAARPLVRLRAHDALLPRRSPSSNGDDGDPPVVPALARNRFDCADGQGRR